MKNMPRILPLAGIAVVGVLAVNAMAGARSASDLFSGARAFAEDLAGGKPGQVAPAAPLDPSKAGPKPAAVCAPIFPEWPGSHCSAHRRAGRGLVQKRGWGQAGQ